MCECEMNDVCEKSEKGKRGSMEHTHEKLQVGVMHPPRSTCMSWAL
jgi:hypothetical protein